MAFDLDDFTKKYMKKGRHVVPARLQTALALLERLRGNPSLNLVDHLASKGSSGLESHETFGHLAHKRLSLEPINRNHGRRSSSLQDWGQQLLDILDGAGFKTASSDARGSMIDMAQSKIAEILRGILEQEPLEVRVRGRTAEAVIREALKQAEYKGKSGEVVDTVCTFAPSLALPILFSPVYGRSSISTAAFGTSIGCMLPDLHRRDESIGLQRYYVMLKETN